MINYPKKRGFLESRAAVIAFLEIMVGPENGQFTSEFRGAYRCTWCGNSIHPRFPARGKDQHLQEHAKELGITPRVFDRLVEF